MSTGNIVAAIDIGTTKVCTLVGQENGIGGIEVIGVGVSPSRGISKGMIVDLGEATEAVRHSVEQAERSSGSKILSAYVSITGNHISSVNHRGAVTISRHDRLVCQEDVDRVLDAAKLINVANSREILHVLPRGYILDNQSGVKDPVGLHGYRLDVEAHIITGAVTSIQNIATCVQKVGVEVEALVFEPLVSSEAVLTEEEREIGVLLADVGGGTTDTAVFINGSIWHASMLPVGGNHLTQDLVIGLRAPLLAAENAKVLYGHCDPSTVNPDEEVEIESFGSERKRTIKKGRISEIVRARVEELLELLADDVRKSGYDSVLPAGLVLTGGTAKLRGIAEVASEVLNMPVRVASPRDIYGLTDSINNPAYSTSVGLLIWGLRHGHNGIVVTSERGGALSKGFGRLLSWARELLPT